MNNINIVGRLGADPEIKFVGDTQVCNFNVATDNMDKNKTTTWHKVEVWGKSAENCAEYLKKGSTVALNGEQRYNIVGEGETKKTYPFIRTRFVKFVSSSNSDKPVANQNQEFVPKQVVHSQQATVPF